MKRINQKEETRIKILTTAIYLYGKHGFQIPTSQIAKEAGISHGSIFSHFKSKEILLEAVVDYFSDILSSRLRQLTNANHSLYDLLFAHLSIIEQHEFFYKRLISEPASLPKSAKYTMISLQSLVSIHFIEIIQKKVVDSKIAMIPISMLFSTWLGLIHYYLQNSDLFTPNESVISRYKEELIMTFTTLISHS